MPLPQRPALARLAVSLARNTRLTVWNPSGLRALRRDVAATPAAIVESASSFGFRAGASAFYRMPAWLMTPVLGIAWLVQALRPRRDR